jgi:hypothetical protein
MTPEASIVMIGSSTGARRGAAVVARADTASAGLDFRGRPPEGIWHCTNNKVMAAPSVVLDDQMEHISHYASASLWGDDVGANITGMSLRQRCSFSRRSARTCGRPDRIERASIASDHESIRPPSRSINIGVLMLGTIILIILVLLLIGALPVYPYSRKWGYAPGGVLGLIVIVLVILLILGRI